MSKSRNESYKLVRYNATKHGILSRHVVLPHEDKEEFNGLLADLINEHQPSGPTEKHMVEDLAGIIWRKRRVLQAEYADVNKNLARAARTATSVLNSALPFQQNLWDSGEDLTMFIDLDIEETSNMAEEAMAELRQISKVEQIIREGGKTAYHRALKALPSDWPSVWRIYLEETGAMENIEALKEFIDQRAIPAMISIYRSGKHHQAVKAQAHGEGLQADKLEKLIRYESHLDRKLERILAMLLKLKELRAATK